MPWWAGGVVLGVGRDSGQLMIEVAGLSKSPIWKSPLLIYKIRRFRFVRIMEVKKKKGNKQKKSSRELLAVRALFTQMFQI